MALVELTNIEFSYRNNPQPVLLIDSLSFAEGETVFLFGPSGCGKTTLLEILAGVLAPQKGQVKIKDVELNQISPSGRDKFRAAHMGYIFQSFNLIPYLSVLENITLPLALSHERQSRIAKNQVQQEVENLCQVLGISDLLHRGVTELSVGQQQRVAAARALLGGPELILADEPTSALDFDHREKFLQLIFKICKLHKTTLIFVSHDRSLQNLFDRTISLPEINRATGARP